jgi:hypothetical protein
MKLRSHSGWTLVVRLIGCLVAVVFASCTSCRSCHDTCRGTPAGPAVSVTPAPTPAVAEAPPAAAVFESPQAAMLAIASAAETGDFDRIKAIFWRDCGELLDPSEESAYGDDCVHLAGMIRERLSFDESAGRTVAVVGKDLWRFPVPIVRQGSGWAFDLAQGQEELLTREIGRNELLTIEALEEYADAQREYASESRDGKPRGFARRFESTEGKRDGLHWKAADGEKGSPMGPLLAEAANESGKEPRAAFNGYQYRMLLGGCRSPYAVESRPTVGCAALAWPAVHGLTGVMTFMVNQAGIVFEKDLGPETSERVEAITWFELDPGWRPSRAALDDQSPTITSQ